MDAGEGDAKRDVDGNERPAGSQITTETASARGWGRAFLDHLTGRRPSLDRLRAEIEPTSAEVKARRVALRKRQKRGDETGEEDSVRAGPIDRPGNPWIEGAEGQLHEARRALHEGRPDAGWQSLLQARRLLLYTYDETDPSGQSELRARATAISSEAEEKLDGWRLEAIDKLLSPDDPEWRPSPAAVYAAAQILDARHGNVHRRVAFVRKQVLTLAVVQLVAMLGLFAVARYWGSPFTAAAESTTMLVTVALFGLMGAAVGRLVALASASHPEKLPVLAANWWMALGRTFMGAAAALALYAFLLSGLVAFGGVAATPPTFNALVLAVAFAAGFSERLLERALAAVGGTDRTEQDEPGRR